MPVFPFAKLCPGGNPTILIRSGHPLLETAEGRARTAEALMHPLHLQAEQVGFIELGATCSLTMMGGEFCVNAARSAAFLMQLQGLLSPCPDTGLLLGEIHSSGLSSPLPVRVRPGTADHLADCAVRVPLTPAPALEKLEKGVVIARLPGITHLLLDEAVYPLPADPLKDARKWRERYTLATEEAAGVIWHRRAEGKHRIHPLVWVRDTGSEVMESACGSGSLALALCLDANLSVGQRSGDEISVQLERADHAVMAAWVGGPVRLVAQGETWVDA